MTTASRNSRLEVRLDPKRKGLIEQAAAALGQTISSFAVSTLVEEARKVVERHGRIRMSDRDRDAFLVMLDSPPRPNDRLRRAAKRHLQSARK